MKLRIGCVVVGFLSFVLSLAAQTASSGSTSSQVPPLIQFSNVATDEGGDTLSGVVSITFSLYTAQQAGDSLWTEMQNNVQLDPTGHYSVQLGITKPNGVSTTLFTTGEARWLGVRIAEQPEQPRVLLVSVPYALKAGDAATVGGLPPSAFVLAAPPNGSASAYTTESATGQSAPPPSSAITGTGTVNFVPLWDTTSDIISSVIFQSGSGTTAKIGINNTTPASTLDVKGGGTIRGILSLPNTGLATATKGANSQPMNLTASAFNSGTAKAVNQTFQWQAEPAANDTSSPSATLNLLFGSGTSKPTETGLNIASNGQITFATGQTFPGTGTITGVTTASGSGLTGGGTSGTLNLALTNTCAANQVLQWNGTSWACATLGGTGTITGVTAGTDLTGGGTSGNVTLSLNTAATNALYAQLGAANTFTASQTVNGTLTATSIGNSIVGNTSGINGTGTGVIGNSTVTTGPSLGVLGETSSTGGSGVEGYASATTGNAFGVWGIAASPTGYGVYGEALAKSGNPTGVYGTAQTGTGVYGTSYTGFGVIGLGGTGVQGQSTGCCGVGGNFSGFSQASGSVLSGTNGVDAQGGNGDPTYTSIGGTGVKGVGGTGSVGDGPGGNFSGGCCGGNGGGAME